MFMSSSTDLKGPRVFLCMSILSDSTGPMPGKVLKISLSARFIDMGRKKIFAIAGGSFIRLGILVSY